MFSGFAIRSIHLTSVPTGRLIVSDAQEQILSVSFSKRKKKEICASDEKEDDEGSLVKKPWVRRHVVHDDESTVSQNQPSASVPFQLVDEPENAPLDIYEDEEAGPTLNPPQVLLKGFLPKDSRARKKILDLFWKSHPLQLFL